MYEKYKPRQALRATAQCPCAEHGESPLSVGGEAMFQILRAMLMTVKVNCELPVDQSLQELGV
ncbi:hypothetical protein [Paraburkholderia nemoris]|uniref:hypothetical protein n=1 Tax=Paraburkholderia nemoris TaxID=2793076 RepID=UPI001B215838|nr:hypothetical protein [Paraburkholderia nemoris]CAE6858375.1 hypothetical protein R75777_07910 [Paraburkholderia nemoris]